MEPSLEDGLRTGCAVQVLSPSGSWRPCTVVDVRPDGPDVLIHYDGFESNHDEWIPLSAPAERGHRLRRPTDWAATFDSIITGNETEQPIDEQTFDTARKICRAVATPEGDLENSLPASAAFQWRRVSLTTAPSQAQRRRGGCLPKRPRPSRSTKTRFRTLASRSSPSSVRTSLGAAYRSTCLQRPTLTLNGSRWGPPLQVLAPLLPLSLSCSAPMA